MWCSRVVMSCCIPLFESRTALIKLSTHTGDSSLAKLANFAPKSLIEMFAAQPESHSSIQITGMNFASCEGKSRSLKINSRQEDIDQRIQSPFEEHIWSQQHFLCRRRETGLRFDAFHAYNRIMSEIQAAVCIEMLIRDVDTEAEHQKMSLLGKWIPLGRHMKHRMDMRKGLQKLPPSCGPEPMEDES